MQTKRKRRYRRVSGSALSTNALALQQPLPTCFVYQQPTAPPPERMPGLALCAIAVGIACVEYGDKATKQTGHELIRSGVKELFR